MQIADIWLRDMPQQFQGKHNIEVLIKAFSKQMQEVDRVFQDLNTMTDIETATGKNLDYVGTIVSLSRKEAGELAGIRSDEPVMPDERYRQFLRYKSLADTSECTYYDMVSGIELLFKYESIRYTEDPAHPATVIFKTPRMPLGEADPVEFRPELCIRPSGVGVMLEKWYGDSFRVDVCSQVAAVRFRTEFYPMFNLPELCLDGSWELDGSQSLDGYYGGDTIDLNPVSMAVQVPVRVDTGTDCQMRIQCGTEVASEAGVAVRMSGKSEHETGTEARTRMSFSVEHRIFTGAVMHKENDLDDGWMLDGTRCLDGGDYPL